MMSINWFSPLPPAPTDIAHYTARTLPALCRRAQVTLWTDQETWDKRLEKLAPVRRFQAHEPAWKELNRADISFYHIGNNPLFHGPIWQMSQRAPGVVVLHDFRLHHFFDGLYREQWHDPDGYLAALEKYHGPESRADGEYCYSTNASNINEMAERYPLTGLACAGALGVLVHTREAFDTLKKDALQPVSYAPLPFTTPPAPKKDERAAGPPYRLIVFGYLGRNRCLAQIFQALGGLPEKDKFRLDIYGEVTDLADVEASLTSAGLRGMAKIHGFVTEAKLDAALRRAHLAFNLRYPTMGEASGSQLRIWSHALPSLVTRIGWYATLSPEAVAFVRPEREVSDIKAHLQAFLADPSRFAAQGAQGREILQHQHAPETYADSLLAIAHHAQAWRGKVRAYDLTERAAGLLSAWDGALSHTRTAREIALLAGWQQPSAADYEQTAIVMPPTAPPVTWRARVQHQLDRWLLGAKDAGE